MTNIYDVTKYILTKQGEMSTMKLQKLCYYCQAWSLVWDDKPLFAEEFHAWETGPVCEELFYQTHGQSSVVASDEPGDINNLTYEQKETIDSVLNYYAHHNAQWLSRLAHLEDPWKLARNNISSGLSRDDIITKESMAIYYSGL